MTDTPPNNDLSEIPSAVSEPKRRYTVQLVWIIPIVAAIIGLSIGIRAYLERGQMITITFKTGEGMEAGKTKIKYKDVQIGEVKGLSISRDRSQVVVTAEINKDAVGLLVQDTRFYVVRARISGGTVSGLSTLLGGSFIGVDAGTSKLSKEDFVGLETPPAVSADVPGRQFLLRAADVGSLDTGSPVLYRRLQVGHVISTELNSDGKGVTVKVFVKAPFDQYVKGSTVFWQASGIDFSLNANGVKVNTESMVSILFGGISFLTPEQVGVTPPAKADSVFPLYTNRDDAMKRAETAQPFALVFHEPVRGLTVGAPVDLRGVTVGEVTKVDVSLNAKGTDFFVPVEILLYPERMHALGHAQSAKPVPPQDFRQLLDKLVAHGLRAELRSGSLLTGQLYVALDLSGKSRPARVDWNGAPPRFPTIPSSVGEMQKNLNDLVRKIDQLPLKELANDTRASMRSLDDALKSADKVLKNVDSALIPEARSVLNESKQSLDELRKTLGEARKTLGGANEALSPQAPLQVDLRDALREVSRAAQSLKELSDYLEQHPESLVRGKKEDKR